jgi:hypothetical protein
MANILGAVLPENAAEDSVSFFPALLGKEDPTKEHKAVMHQSTDGDLAIRQGDWKLIFMAGSGGRSLPEEEAKARGLPMYQLYNLRDDPGEKNNLFEKQRVRVEQMTQVARQFVVNGRSTPGTPQRNDTLSPNDDPNDWEQLHWMK